MALQDIRLKIQKKVDELILKEDLALQLKNSELDRLAKNPAVKKKSNDEDRYAGELIKAAGVSILASFLITKIFKIKNPVVKTLLVPIVTSAIMKTELINKISDLIKKVTTHRQQKLIENR